MSLSGVAYYLGIDGGQGSTRGLIVRSDGVVHGSSIGGPIPHILAEGGLEEFGRVLRATIDAAMNGHEVPIRSAFLGLSGVVPGGRLEAAVRACATQLLGDAQIGIDSDGSVALAGALALEPGLIAIAGTGSLVVGVDANGQFERAGGWGYLFGDEAGAFGIARDAIRRVLRQVDRGGPGTALADTIVAHFNGCNLSDIPRAFYAGEFDRVHVAQLVPRLAQLAQGGDDLTRDVFSAAAAVLAEQMRAVAARLCWNSNLVRWAPIGGVFASGGVFSDPLEAALSKDSTHRFVRVQPLAEPAMGAVWLAAERVGDARPSATSVQV